MNKNRPTTKSICHHTIERQRNLHYDPKSSFTNDGCAAITEGTIPE